jgi:hypothetical protein
MGKVIDMTKDELRVRYMDIYTFFWVTYPDSEVHQSLCTQG